ncbi:MAG TPA: hypothetical protein VN886_11820 [Acidimicrobiales bacterium]|nr:hypothetical protein [Acidimicrobiales bacterium]
MRTRPGGGAAGLALAAVLGPGLGVGVAVGVGVGVCLGLVVALAPLGGGLVGVGPWPASSGAVTSTSTSTAAPPSPLATVVLSELGPGYAVTSEGPLDAGSFASSAPDASAASGALASLGTSISTYQREWADNGGSNEVQDLLVKFPSTAPAQIFLAAMQRSLDSGDILSSGPVAGVPGARTVKYFAATSAEGVGQAVTMRVGVYVDLLSFFSASGAAQPITPADAAVLAKAQHAAMETATGGTATAPGGDALGWIALALAVLVIVVVSVVVHRRRHPRSVTPAG